MARVHVLVRLALETAREEGFVAAARRTADWLARRARPREEPAEWTSPIEERYARWRGQHEPTTAKLERQRAEAAAETGRPLFSVVVPVFDPPPQVLARCVGSVLSQTYPELELCVANAGTSTACAAVLADAAARDPRVRVTRLESNLGISGNSNAALALARGEFVALLDHDDELAPHALHAVRIVLERDPTLDVVYSDEDRLDADGNRVRPFLKPDWSPELLHSFMYIGHLTVYRRSFVEQLGGFRGEFDGSQDYDLILRATEVTDRIGHVPEVLYHWRMTRGSAAAGGKSDARRSNLAALQAAVDRRGHHAQVLKYPWANRVAYALPPQRPLVSIVIPTDDAANVHTSLEALLGGTDYPALEVIVVTNSALAEAIDARRHRRVRTVRFDEPFNFSAKCNAGAGASRGDYICFLNDDVEPLMRDWLDSLLQYAQLPEIGGVSPKLLYADDTIQYAGLVNGVPDFIGTACHMWPRNTTDYTNFALSVRNVGCLTGACMLLRREVLERAGAWDAENTPIAHSDFDLSLRIRALALRLVYTPFAELRHFGSRARRAAADNGSRPYERVDRGVDLYMTHRWGADYAYDPYYPPGMRDLLYEDDRPWTLLPPQPSDVEARWWEKRRIALVSHNLSRTGAPGILLEIAGALRDAGAWPVVVSPVPGPLMSEVAAAGIPLAVDGAILEEPRRSARLLAAFDALIGSTVHAHEAVIDAAEAGKPTALLVQEGAFGLYQVGLRPRATRALELADVVVFPSRQAAGHYEGFPGRGLRHVVHYGIADPALLASPERRLPRTGEKLTVVQVGSLEPRKGPHVLIEAVRRLPHDLAAGVELFLVGSRFDDPWVDDFEESLRTVPNARFIGERSRADALACIRDADVFVSASRDESGPLVVLEAMALGTPVVTTRVGAMPELLTDGVDADLVDVDDVEELTARLERLLRNPELREQRARAARERYERSLTSERYMRDLLRVLAPLLTVPEAGESSRRAVGVEA